MKQDHSWRCVQVMKNAVKVSGKEKTMNRTAIS